MPVPADQKFSGFADGGNLAINDIVVGLRNGVNTRFNFDGFPGVYLPLAGGTMTGTINMDTNSITGLPIPTNPTDAASKAYVDSVTAPVGLVGTIQRSTGTDWVASTATFADTYAVSTLLFAGSANAVSGLPTAASGLLVTSAGGVPSIGTDIPTAVTIGGAYIYRVGGTDVAVADGGTGASTFTAYSVICAGTTATGAFQNVVGVGTLNQVLVSQGAGALPQWGSVPGLVPAALTRTDDTNVTLTLGGTPTTALLQATSLTLGWTGQLSLTRGGSNASLTASNGGVVYSTATAMAILAGTATANLPLLSGSSAAPSWGAFALNLGGALTTADALTTSGAFSATFTFTGVTGVTFPTSGTLATTSQIPTGAALTRTDDTNVTLTLGGSPTTALINATSITVGWTGQLALTRGGSNASLAASNGGIVYSTATAMAILAGTATAGQIIRSGASTTPSWSTATYPATAGTSGNVMTSDGTNWNSSAPVGATVTIVDDTATNATMYPTWVTANTGNLPLKVTSTKLFYNPSTGTLTNIGALAQITNIVSSTGAICLNFNYTASAVNYVQITNNQTGVGVSIGSTGADASVPLGLNTKNSYVSIQDGTATIAPTLRFYNAANNFYTGLKVATAQATDATFTLPAAVPAVNNAIMQSTTGGVLSLSSVPYPAALGWTTFTPTITLVGGAGNTVPTYTTSVARYTQIGNTVYVSILLSNAAGGTAGAGTGVLNIALPVATSASVTTGQLGGGCGTLLNSAAFEFLAVPILSTSGTTVTIGYQTAIGTQTVASGNSQTDAVRKIALSFCYEI